jgi:hypothetical protein
MPLEVPSVALKLWLAANEVTPTSPSRRSRIVVGCVCFDGVCFAGAGLGVD